MYCKGRSQLSLLAVKTLFTGALWNINHAKKKNSVSAICFGELLRPKMILWVYSIFSCLLFTASSLSGLAYPCLLHYMHSLGCHYAPVPLRPLLVMSNCLNHLNWCCHVGQAFLQLVPPLTYPVYRCFRNFRCKWINMICTKESNQAI